MQDNVRDFLIAIFNAKKKNNIPYNVSVGNSNTCSGYWAITGPYSISYYIYNISVSGNTITITLYTNQNPPPVSGAACYYLIYGTNTNCSSQESSLFPVTNMLYTLIVIQLTVQ